MRFARCFTLLVLVSLLAGCAGGWRGGSAPAEWASAAATAPAPAGKASASAPAANAAAASAKATHGTADGALFVWTGEGASVNVAGEFNAWSTSADPMQKQADGSFTLARKLAAGKYQYKFVVDGTNWKEDPNARETADDGYGGKNAIVVVGGAAASAAASPQATAAPAPASAVKPLAPDAKARAPQVTAAGVVFTYAGVARASVALCGDFNSWATTADAMTQQADGTWTITRKLAPGTYGYKFLVDGASWKQDGGNPQGQDDGFGGKNSVVTVK